MNAPRSAAVIKWDAAPIRQQFGDCLLVADGVAMIDGKEYRINASASRTGRNVELALRHLSPARRGALVAESALSAVRAAASESASDLFRAFRVAERFGETRPTLESLAPRIDAARQQAGKAAALVGSASPATAEAVQREAAADMGFATESVSAVPVRLGTVETIDMTPTWAAVLPIYIACLEDGTETGRRAARVELARMAALADRFNALAADMKAAR